MKKKIIITILFFISLLPMLLNQYGAAKGVQEISGIGNLLNPIGIISFILFFIIEPLTDKFEIFEDLSKSKR